MALTDWDMIGLNESNFSYSPFSATDDLFDEDFWGDLDCDLEEFLLVEELLNGRKSCWVHRRLD